MSAETFWWLFVGSTAASVLVFVVIPMLFGKRGKGEIDPWGGDDDKEE